MKIGILGTGAFGMALASIFDYNKCSVSMWTNSASECDMILKTGKNNRIDYDIPKHFLISTDMEKVIKGCDIIVIAVPTEFVRSVCNTLKMYYDKKQVICIASKGIDNDSLEFLSDVVYDTTGADHLAVISGGTFAIDIINRAPVGFTLASNDNFTIDMIVRAMKNSYVNFMITDDIIGTEICGAVKNVFAIASGIIDGMNMPISTLVMFLTEAFRESIYFTSLMGGKKDTLYSFAGIGDIILTCTSTKSRNYTLGRLIGEGNSKEVIDEYIKNTTVEGLNTLCSIKNLITDRNINIPIIDCIYDVVIDGEDASTIIDYLINKK